MLALNQTIWIMLNNIKDDDKDFLRDIVLIQEINYVSNTI